MFVRIASLCYRIVLRACPASFRRQFGGELREVFEAKTTALLETAGYAAAAAFVVRSWADGVGVGVAERRDQRARRTGRRVSASRRRPSADSSPRFARQPGRDRPPLLSSLSGDARFALRTLTNNPAFTGVAVLSLALAIGANTAIFSIVDGVILRPLQFPDAGQLAHVWRENKPWELYRLPMGVPVRDLSELSRRSHQFEQLEGYVSTEVDLTGREGAEQVRLADVTPGFFSLLGLGAARGRILMEDDREFAERPIVVGARLWRNRYAARDDIIGQSIEVNGVTHVVVGVLDPAYEYPADTVLWRLLDTQSPDPETQARTVGVLGRILKGSDSTAAEVEIKQIAAQLEEEYPQTNQGWGAWVEPLHHRVVGDAGSNLFLLFGAVGFVLLIACANVASLLLVRATSRHEEVAIRAALGAGRGRIVRQLFVESLILASCGGILGLVLAVVGLDTLLLMVPEELPRLDEVAINGRVLAFSVMTTLAAGLLFGVFPALKATRLADAAALRSAAGGAGRPEKLRARGAFVIVQVALGVVLMVGAGLMVNSFVRLVNVDPGFDPGNVVRVGIDLPEHRYDDGNPANLQLYRDVVERLRLLPDAEVALGTNYPMSNRRMVAGIEVEGRQVYDDDVPMSLFANDQKAPAVEIQAVTPEYFAVLGIAVRRGRALDASDTQTGILAGVVNETMARMMWPGEDPVGNRLRFISGDPEEPQPWITVVGVIADFKQASLDASAHPELTVAVNQRPAWTATFPRMNLLIKAPNKEDIVPAVRAAIQAVDPDLPVPAIDDMETVVSASIAQPRFLMTVLACFAGAALVLSALGIYGVMAFSVMQRTFEIGVRIALGAKSSDVLTSVLRRAMFLVAIGLGSGLLAAYWLSRYLSGLLYGVAPTDLATIAAAGLIFIAASLIAAYFPARRASRVDPVRTLRGLT